MVVARWERGDLAEAARACSAAIAEAEAPGFSQSKAPIVCAASREISKGVERSRAARRLILDLGAIRFDTYEIHGVSGILDDTKGVILLRQVPFDTSKL